MASTSDIAAFAQAVEYDALDEPTVAAVKRRLLDSVGIALGASDEDTPAAVRAAVDAEHGGGDCTLWATDGTASPVGAAMYNTTLTRYLDFMDSFLAPGETPHPSDNVGAAVACAEYADASGEELLAAVAAAYEVQGELAWNAPVRDEGWDHVTHTVISATVPAAMLFGLDEGTTQDAVGIAGTAHNALRVTRTGGINEWKGVASANAARNAVFSARLAEQGVEGPRDLFEGQKGWQQVISGEFEVDLDPACPRVHDTMTKRYVAETYAQSAVEAIIDLANEHDPDPGDVAEIRLTTFGGAKLIIGGGEGDRHAVETRAQADHSLPYMLAVAFLDRELGDDQYDPDRIRRDDVQELLRKVDVTADERFTEQFEDGLMPAEIEVELADGTVLEAERDAFLGHPEKPMDFEDVERKFRSLADGVVDDDTADAIVDCVRTLDDRDARDLTGLLATR